MRVVFLFLVFGTLFSLPSRKEQFAAIKEEEFDVVIVGGGATGAGAAWEASSRGLKVLLVEKNDFGSQTSSRSTKLIHGGVRYLEKAFRECSLEQFGLVKEALKERSTLFQIAPHAVKPIKILTPLFSWSELPYYWIGLKLYDLIAGRGSLGKSHFVSASAVAQAIPNINRERLKGGVVYYDGQFNDTRMNITLVLSAMKLSALCLNYTEAISFKKNEHIKQVRIRNRLTGKEYDVKCRVVINATGPFSDHLRLLDNPSAQPLIHSSSGTHILLDKEYLPSQMGVLIPKTEDGRVLFMLPWQGSTLVGTTDHSTAITENPVPHKEDLSYLLAHFNDYLVTPVKPENVKAVWTGIRPLVSNATEKNSAQLSRSHVIEVSESHLISIMGGKWTTFRKMGQDVVDRAIAVGELKATPSVTEGLQLLGAKGYNKDAARNLCCKTRLSMDVCEHLMQSYGMLSYEVVKEGSLERIVAGYPVIEAEILWALKNEFAFTIMDVLSRRTRLAFLDAKASFEALDRVAIIMGKHFGWSDEELAEQVRIAKEDLRGFLP